MARVVDPFEFSATLAVYVQRSLYSAGQLEALSGVPRRTIVNWLDGTVRRPREWRQVAKLAGALRLTRLEFERLLAAGRLPSLAQLAQNGLSAEDRARLEPWLLQITKMEPGNEAPAREAPAREVLLWAYLQDLIGELTKLPAYFPRGAAFTFQAIRQDPALRHPEFTTQERRAGAADETDGTMWSLLREQTPRAVILGQPGMGKSWLLRAEALHWMERAWATGTQTVGTQTVGTQTVGTQTVPAYVPILVRVPDWAIALNGEMSITAMLRAAAEVAAQLAPGVHEQALVNALRDVMEQTPERVIWLFDALDEVPNRQGLRAKAREALSHLARRTSARFLLTCRTLGYAAAPFAPYLGEEFVELEIAPFTNRQIYPIMQAWFEHDPPLFHDLHVAVRRAPALIRQAANPLLLSLICMLAQVHGRKVLTLRSGLYEPALRLLLEGHWRPFALRLPENRVRLKLRLLEQIAWLYATYQDSWWEHLSGDLLEPMIEQMPEAQRLWLSWQPDWGATYEGPLWELSEWDGILVKSFIPLDNVGSAVPYVFLHRTFQEFLVARYLLRRYGEAGIDAPEIVQFLTWKAADPSWFVVLMLLVEMLRGGERLPVEPLLGRITEVVVGTLQDHNRHGVIAAAELLLQSQTSLKTARLTDVLREQLQAHLVDGQQPPPLRCYAGRLLAELGDPRLNVMDVDAMEWLCIPAGPFWMGSDPQVDRAAAANEFPYHERFVGDFAIMRYPVSNAQMLAFVNDPSQPYFNPAYWPEAIAAGHWRPGELLRRVPPHQGFVRPWHVQWTRQLNPLTWPNNLPNHPAHGCNWYEARAFARWLTDRRRAQGRLGPDEWFDLPSEAEWEKAARGTDGRIYPWGNDWDPTLLNWQGLMLMSAFPIGCFPNGASPYGVEEMVGGFWELTRSRMRPYDASGDDASGDDASGDDASGVTVTDIVAALGEEDRVVARGGSHIGTRDTCRTASREAVDAMRFTLGAFRLVRLSAR